MNYARYDKRMVMVQIDDHNVLKQIISPWELRHQRIKYSTGDQAENRNYEKKIVLHEKKGK